MPSVLLFRLLGASLATNLPDTFKWRGPQREDWVVNNLFQSYFLQGKLRSNKQSLFIRIVNNTPYDYAVCLHNLRSSYSLILKRDSVLAEDCRYVKVNVKIDALFSPSISIQVM